MPRLSIAAISIILCASSCISCGTNTTDNKPEESQVAAPIESESITKTPPSYKLSAHSAGPFSIGLPIPHSLDRFDITTYNDSTIDSDGDTIIIPVYRYDIGNEGYVRVIPLYDESEKRFGDRIGEIFIYSECFSTDKGIGAMSTLEEFADTYPEVSISYCPKEGMFAISTPELPGMVFLLSPEHYMGTPGRTEDLELSDFSVPAYFHSILMK